MDGGAFVGGCWGALVCDSHDITLRGGRYQDLQHGGVVLSNAPGAVLGRTRMPVHMLLRMGRGAVIELDSIDGDMVEILANDHPVARGQITVNGPRMAVEVTEMIRKPEPVREPGITLGEGAVAAIAAVPA